MPRRKQTSVSASVEIGGNTSMRPSLAPTASNSILTPTGSRKRVRSSPPPCLSRGAALTNATKSSKPKADNDSPRPSHVSEKELTHPPLIRSISSDSYFVSALTRDPNISLFVAHSPLSDFSLLCDDSVLAALNDGDNRPSFRKQPLAPLQRLKVRARPRLTPALLHSAFVQAAVSRVLSSLHSSPNVVQEGGKSLRRTRSCSRFVHVCWQGETIKDVQVLLQDRPAALKLLLEHSLGVPAAAQRLSFRGKVLQDNIPLYAATATMLVVCDALRMIESGVDSGSCIDLTRHAEEATAAAAATSWIPEDMQPRVNNIVASVQLSCCLSLKSLSDRMCNTEYNPRRFNALTVRIKSPKVTALVYSTGKMVVTGARSMEDLELAVRLLARAICKAGHPTCQVLSKTISNMVAGCDIRAPLRLEALHHALGGAGGGAIFDMEIFPAVIYRLSDPDVTMNIFSTGKVTITGATNHTDILAALEKLLPVLLLYKRD